MTPEQEVKEFSDYLKSIDILFKYLKKYPYVIDTIINGLIKLKNDNNKSI